MGAPKRHLRSLAQDSVVSAESHRAPGGGGTKSWRQIARAVPIGISRWRGTGARTSSEGLCQIVCLPPSRSASHPFSTR
jgi:hypothetical protein